MTAALLMSRSGEPLSLSAVSQNVCAELSSAISIDRKWLLGNWSRSSASAALLRPPPTTVWPNRVNSETNARPNPAVHPVNQMIMAP